MFHNPHQRHHHIIYNQKRLNSPPAATISSPDTASASLRKCDVELLSLCALVFHIVISHYFLFRYNKLRDLCYWNFDALFTDSGVRVQDATPNEIQMSFMRVWLERDGYHLGNLGSDLNKHAMLLTIRTMIAFLSAGFVDNLRNQRLKNTFKNGIAPLAKQNLVSGLFLMRLLLEKCHCSCMIVER